MGIVQQKNKYEQYLEKVSETSTELENDMTLRTIKIRIEDIFKELSNKEDVFFHKNLFRMLAIPAVAVFLISIFFFNSIVGIIGIFTLIGFTVHHRRLMIQKTLDIKKESVSIKPDESRNISDLVALIHYLVKGAELKISRMNSVRWFYAILFPLTMVVSAQFIFSSLNFTELVISLVFAAIVGGLFWVYHFYSEINKYEVEAEELENYLDQLEQY